MSEKDYTPAPIEQFHGEILEKFHQVKRESNEGGVGVVDGIGFNKLIAEFKCKIIDEYGLSTTGEEYKKHGKFLPEKPKGGQ